MVGIGEYLQILDYKPYILLNSFIGRLVKQIFIIILTLILIKEI